MPTSDKVVLDFNEKSPAAWLFALWGRRWIRVVLVSVALLVVAGGVWYQTVVKPTLTATELTLWAAGDDRRTTVEVNNDANTVIVSDGQAGLSRIAVAGNSMFVLAAEVGVDEEVKWVELSLSDLDPRFGAITPERILSALVRDVKECRPPSDDAQVLLQLLLGMPPPQVESDSLCGSAFRNVAEPGRDSLVEVDAVPPSDGAQIGASVVTLAEVTDPASVVAVLDLLLAA